MLRAGLRDAIVLRVKQINAYVSKACPKRRNKEISMKLLIGYDWPEGRSKQVAYISQDHHIHEFSVGTGGSWQHVDISQLFGAPLASSRFLRGSK